MTKSLRLFIVSTSLTLFACSGGPTFEISNINGHIDTINLTDKNGLRQGLWLMPISKDTMIYLDNIGHSTKGGTSGQVIRHLKEYGNSLVSPVRLENGQYVVSTDSVEKVLKDKLSQ